MHVLTNDPTTEPTVKDHTKPEHTGKGPTAPDISKMRKTSKLSPCDDSQCQNGATCQKEGLGFTCLCKPGFVGSMCQYTADQMKKGLCIDF